MPALCKAMGHFNNARTKYTDLSYLVNPAINSWRWLKSLNLCAGKKGLPGNRWKAPCAGNAMFPVAERNASVIGTVVFRKTRAPDRRTARGVSLHG